MTLHRQHFLTKYFSAMEQQSAGEPQKESDGPFLSVLFAVFSLGSAYEGRRSGTEAGSGTARGLEYVAFAYLPPVPDSELTKLAHVDTTSAPKLFTGLLPSSQLLNTFSVRHFWQHGSLVRTLSLRRGSWLELRCELRKTSASMCVQLDRYLYDVDLDGLIFVPAVPCSSQHRPDGC